MAKGNKLIMSDYFYIEDAYKIYISNIERGNKFYALLELRNKALIGRLLSLDNHFTEEGYELFREPVGMDEHLTRMQPIFEIINKHISNFNPLLFKQNNDIKIENILDENCDNYPSSKLYVGLKGSELQLNLLMYKDDEHKKLENIVTIVDYNKSDIIFMDLLAKDLVSHINTTYEFEIPLYELLDK